MSEFCNCDETFVNGGRVPKPLFHSCVYIRERTRLVVKAEKVASMAIDGMDPSVKTKNIWTRTFAKEMDRLAQPLLRNGQN